MIQTFSHLCFISISCPRLISFDFVDHFSQSVLQIRDSEIYFLSYSTSLIPDEGMPLLQEDISNGEDLPTMPVPLSSQLLL
jgi:hypothetical protein